MAIIALSIAGFIAILLCIPLDLEFRIDIHKKLDFTARRVWLFGLVKKELKRERHREPGNRIEQARVILQYLQTGGLLRQLRCLLKDVFRVTKLKELKIDLTIGTGDPADTAMLCGALWLPALIGNTLSPARISIKPSFGEAVFEGKVHGRARLRPIRLVVPFLKFAFSPPARRVFKKWIENRWKRGKGKR